MDALLYPSARDGASSDSQYIPSSAEWEGRRADIERLYVDERRSLKEVIATMTDMYEFKATPQMYKRRLAKWKLNKNNRRKMVLAILRKQNERLASGKSTTFFIHGREVNMEDLMRHAKRNGANLAEAYQNNPSHSPTPDGLECVTPVPSWHEADDIHGSPSLAPCSRPKELHNERLLWLSTTSPIQPGVMSQYERFLSSSKAPELKADSRGWISRQGEEACDLLEAARFREAGLRLVHICDSARSLVQNSAFNLIPELIFLVLERARGHRAVIREVLHHFQSMALEFHGADHGLTLVLTSLLRLLESDRTGSFQALRTAMSLVVDCVSSFLGPLHVQSVALRVDFLECSPGLVSSLRSLLDISDRENGSSSPTSFECLRAIAYNELVEQEDVQGAFSLAMEILGRTRKTADVRSRELGLITALSIQIDAALHSRQYEQAEWVIQQLLITASTLSTYHSLHKVALLFRLEDCLRQLGRQVEAQLASQALTLVSEQYERLILE